MKAGVLAPEPAGLPDVVERTLAAADEVREMHGRLSSSRARDDGEDEEDGSDAPRTHPWSWCPLWFA